MSETKKAVPETCKHKHELMALFKRSPYWLGYTIVEAVTNPDNPNRDLFFDTLEEIGITVSGRAILAGERNFYQN